MAILKTLSIPDFSNFGEFSALLVRQIKPHKLNYILAKKNLKWRDFSPMSLDAYQQCAVHEQMRVTTVQKLLNAETDEMALAWMKTIPASEYEDIFDFQRLKRDSYWFRAARCNNAHLLIDVVSRMDMSSRHQFLEITALFSVENVLSHLRDLKRYDILIKLIGLCVPAERLTLFRRYLHSGYLTDFFADQNIAYILELVAMIPDAERVKLLIGLMQAGCLSQTLGCFFEKSLQQLNFEQFMEFMTFKLRYLKDKPVWRICYKYQDVFQHAICAYPEAQRLVFFEEIGIFNLLIRHEKYHHFAMLMPILSLSQQVEYIWNKKYVMYFIQGNMFDELQSLIRHFPQDIQFEFQDAWPIYSEIYAWLALVKSLSVDFKTSIQSEVEALLKEYRHQRIDTSALLRHITLLCQQKSNELQGSALSTTSFFQDKKHLVARLQDMNDQSNEKNRWVIKNVSK
jgi:hypothetical protein